MDLDLDRAHKAVSLSLGVLTGCVSQLPGEHVDEAAESLGVVGRQGNYEGIGRDEAPHTDAAKQVHLPGEAASDLHRLKTAPQALGEGSFDHALKALLELLESHGGARAYRRAPVDRGRSQHPYLCSIRPIKRQAGA